VRVVPKPHRGGACDMSAVQVIELCSETLCIRDAAYRLSHPALVGRVRVFLCAECAKTRAPELDDCGATLVPVQQHATQVEGKD
jgi:hypothetical protein